MNCPLSHNRSVQKADAFDLRKSTYHFVNLSGSQKLKKARCIRYVRLHLNTHITDNFKKEISKFQDLLHTYLPSIGNSYIYVHMLCIKLTAWRDDFVQNIEKQAHKLGCNYQGEISENNFKWPLAQHACCVSVSLF